MHTDRQLVADEYYGTTRILRARQRLFDFQRPRFDLHDDVASVVATAPGPVIDVGCGNGLLRARLAARRPDLDLFGVDVSTGMAPDVVGDVQAFPVADGAAGAVVAMHMLYHVPDIVTAVREMARALRPDGIAVATTNDSSSLTELYTLADHAFADVGGGPVPPRPDARFGLHHAHLLAAAFGEVAVRRRAYTVVCDELEPLLGYLDSLRPAWRHLLPADAVWEDFLTAAEGRLRAVLAGGHFTDHGEAGMIIGRLPRRAG
ncbi:methyltransferase domain-containing protein [Actinoalloteichus sp. AHMU CJ021]|uniref:Methyltransferase domain-containing protein n=1 Tax=Actinoalloteichus caeruleus DSM 43889 TaxID=1120930 RepID=A0ABT1JDN8_ACTCY|nr:class I SAM-dependent methyltransferase [Actinoalloteichus caeruleus]AUS80899.1 methyltransferase domain-containing protein [Actinoalloteichus sp. AHMU CJ021]MCP2330329.1 Methyltransferase domain-containing protein [Actinoalloteichus caeruleus DSM 43889]